MIRTLILLAILVLLVFMPMCAAFDDCFIDSDCDDDNPCTKDVCESNWVGSSGSYYDPDYSCFERTYDYYCEYNGLDNGTPCDADGEPGMCEDGECRLDGEASTPMLDGGV